MTSPHRPAPSLPLTAANGARGVVYVATGESYLAEAREARAQLRRTNPRLPAAIVTNVPDPLGDWQCVLSLAHPTFTLRDKLHMRRAPWPQVLFLDTDTHVTADLGPIFALLDGDFDLAAHQLFEGHNYQLPDVPDSFPEFNTGVIAFKNTDAVQHFFDAWDRLYQEDYPGVACDQRSFRRAVFHAGLRHSVLTPEYNFRPLATNFAITDLRIIHGRPLAAMSALKALIDVNYVHRAYVPRLGCVVSDHMTPGQAWRLWGASTWELLATVSRPWRFRLRRWLDRQD